MNIDNDFEIEEDNFIPEEDVLLFSATPGPRIFTLNNANSTTMLGVLLEETDDSFLVALPSRLIDIEGKLKVESFMAVPYIRLLKSAVLSVLFPFGSFKAMFIPYIINKGMEIYPELEDLIEDLKEELESPTQAQHKEQSEVVYSGMSNEELEQYLTEKFSRGEITSGNGTKQ